MEPLTNREKQTTILAFFPGALGDFLCALPALSALRALCGEPLTLVTRDSYFPLLAAGDFRSLSIDRPEVADLFSNTPLRDDTRRLFGGFDQVHSWTGHSDPTFRAKVTELTKERANFHAFRGMREGEHASDYLARCAGVIPRRVALQPSKEAVLWAQRFWSSHGLRSPVLAIHFGSGAARKNWRGMAEIAQRWCDGRGDVVQIIGPAESSDDALSDLVTLCNESLDRVAAILQKTTLYLGNDSGITHLAAAVQCRGTALFGPTDAATWGPKHTPLQAVSASRTCASCGEEVFCKHRLAPDTVWKHLNAS
jgi:ADP-heptose:LPS heptosyltransferase